MSRGVNKVIVIGNLGADPETRYLPSGVAVCSISVGVTETWKDKQTEETKERTEWVKVEMWGRSAEACAKYLTKGKEVYVEGRMQTSKWQDKDGIDRWTTKVRADNVQFLGSARDNDPSRNQPAPDAEPAPLAGDGKSDDYDDDIPF